MKMNQKRCGVRIGAGLLLLVFCAFFLSFHAYAEDIEGTFTYVTSGIEKKAEQKEAAFVYRDSYWERSSYELNTELAALSFKLAYAGGGIGEKSEPLLLLPFFDKLGFRYSEETVHYEVPGADTIGYAYAVREVSETEAVLLLVVRGGNYQKEWASNFTLGTGNDHDGFSAAAERISKEISAYIATELQDKKVSVWLTGFSRGAAVVNLTAAEFDRRAAEGNLGTVKTEGIYAFCFECPLASKKPDADKDGTLYDNICSFVNENDPVPRVAPGKWGFRRYGRTFLFPSPQNCADYKLYYDEMLAKFYAYADTSTYLADRGQTVFLDHLLRRLSDLIVSQQNYTMFLQDTIRGAVLGEKRTGNVLSTLVMQYADEYMDKAKENPKDSAAMNYAFAHAPELVMAWMDSIGDGSIFERCSPRYLYLAFDGTADASVYDSEGTLLLTGDGKNITYVSDTTIEAAYGISGEFLVSCPEDETLYVTFTAGKRNRVDVVCAIYDMLSYEDTVRYEYNSVLLKKGDGAVAVVRDLSPALYLSDGDKLTGTLQAIVKGESAGEEVEPGSVKGNRRDDKPPVTVTPTPTPTPSPVPTDTPTVTPSPVVSPEPSETDKNGEKLNRVTLILILVLAGVPTLVFAVFMIVRRGRGKEA